MSDEQPIRAARYTVTFDDLFHVPHGWLSWRCRLTRHFGEPGYVDGACRYDHNVDSWEQLQAETAAHLACWHPHITAQIVAPTIVERAAAMGVKPRHLDDVLVPGALLSDDEVRAITRMVRDTTDPALIDTWADPDFVAHQDHKHPVGGCGYCPDEEES